MFQDPDWSTDWYGEPSSPFDENGMNPDIDWFNQDEPASPWDNVQWNNPPQRMNPYGTGEGYLDKLMELNDSARPAMDQYLSHLANQPSREDYKPSMWTRISAALSGAGTGLRGGPGAQVAEQIKWLPFQRQIEDWQTKGRGLGAASQLEYNQLKDQANNLIRAEQARIAWDRAQSGRVSAEASANRAETYKKWVDLPQRRTLEFGGKTYVYDAKSPELTMQELGVSESSLDRGQRAFLAKLARDTQYDIANLHEVGANERQESGFQFRKENPNLFSGMGSRTTATEVLDPEKIAGARNAAVQEMWEKRFAVIQSIPDATESDIKQILIADRSSKGKEYGRRIFVAPSGIKDNERLSRIYKALQVMIDDRAREMMTQTFTHPR